MCSYDPQVNKAVFLLSSMHFDNKMQENEPIKSDMILDYNATKGGVDTLDQLVNNYTCKRVTNRWPIIIFFWMLNVAAYNSAVRFMAKAKAPIYKGHEKRRHFLSALSEQFCKGKIERRFLTENKISTKACYYQYKISTKECYLQSMEAFFNVEKAAATLQNQNNGNQKKRCKKCPRKLEKKQRSHASSVVSQFVTAILNLFVLNVLTIKNKFHLLRLCCYSKYKTI